MAELVTIATIRASDQLTGPLTQMAARIRAINSGIRQNTELAHQNVRNTHTRLIGAGVGLIAMLDHAQEFNKRIFGIGAGQLVDEHSGETRVQFAREEMERMAKYSFDLGRELRFSSTKIAEIGEVLVKAGMKDGLEEMVRASVSLSKADTDTPAKNIADFLHTLSVIYEKDYKKGPGDFIRAQADMIITAADQTKLSVGSIMEGMKQFQTIGASLGLKTPEQLAMLMVGAQAGFGASELGTAYKSNLVRLFKPTAEGQAGMAMMFERLGTQLSDYTAVTAQDPMRAMSNLNRAIGGLPVGAGSRQFSASIRDQLYKAQKGGYSTSDAFVDHITAQYAKMKNITDLKGQQELRRIVASSILTTGGEDGYFNVVKLWKDMARANLSKSQIASIWQGQHMARNNPLLTQLLEGGKFDEYFKLLEKMKGQGLKGIETLWSDSSFGNVEAMKAAIDRLWITLANNKGVQSFVNSVERFTDALTRVNPKVIDFGIKMAALGIIAPIAWSAGKALIFMGAAALAPITSLARLAALPFAAMAAGLLGLGKAATFATAIGFGTTAAAGVGAVAVGLSRILGFAAALMRFGVIGLAAGGILAMILGPEAAIAKFNEFAAGGPVQSLVANMKGLVDGVDQLAQNFLKLFGIETKGSSLIWALEGLVKTLDNAVTLVRKLVDGINELTQSKDKTETAKGIARRTIDGVKTGDATTTGLLNIIPGLGTLLGLLSGNNPFASSNTKLEEAAAKIGNAADRLQAPPAAAPGTKPGTTAPAPAQPNPQQYGAK